MWKTENVYVNRGWRKTNISLSFIGLKSSYSQHDGIFRELDSFEVVSPAVLNAQERWRRDAVTITEVRKWIEIPTLYFTLIFFLHLCFIFVLTQLGQREKIVLKLQRRTKHTMVMDLTLNRYVFAILKFEHMFTYASFFLHQHSANDMLILPLHLCLLMFIEVYWLLVLFQNTTTVKADFLQPAPRWEKIKWSVDSSINFILACILSWLRIF